MSPEIIVKELYFLNRSNWRKIYGLHILLTCIIRTANCTGICINMSPETIALTLFVVVTFSMVISQLASEVSIIPPE